MPDLIRPEGPEADDVRLSRRGLATAGLGGLLFAGYAPAALARQAAPVTTDDDDLTIETTTSPAPDGFDLPLYVARPTGSGPFPVVVVVSEIFGVHEYIRDVCRRLAKAGYAAIAPAFFNRVEDPAPLADMARVQAIVAEAGYEQVMGDVAACHTTLPPQHQPVMPTRSALAHSCWLAQSRVAATSPMICSYPASATIACTRAMSASGAGSSTRLKKAGAMAA